MTAADDAKVIGHFAYTSPSEVICDGDACIIAGSETDLKTYLVSLASGYPMHHTIRKTRFGEIMRGMRLGAA